MKAAALVILAVGLQGCATKHYGRLGELTRMEKDRMTCREIALDRARTHGFIEKVNSESRFDSKDVLAFLGDFGIGNAMEKDAAMASATTRMKQLDELAAEKKCMALAS